jgi:hypothetical protein
MITKYTYKLQGNGQDSWHVDVHDCQIEYLGKLFLKIQI